MVSSLSNEKHQCFQTSQIREICCPGFFLMRYWFIFFHARPLQAIEGSIPCLRTFSRSCIEPPTFWFLKQPTSTEPQLLQHIISFFSWFFCFLLSHSVFLCFPALKRSFEVEETDSSTHPSPLTRRTTNPLRSSTSSASSQRSYDLSSRSSDYSSSRPSESSNLRSPKTGMRRIELSGGRNPDVASARRTEISIEVSSKQIDNSPSAGIARFGLKRPEVSLSSRSTPLDASSNSFSTNRRAEFSVTRPSEPPAPPRRMDAQVTSAPVSRIPEPPQRRAEPPSPAVSPVEGTFRRPEMPVFRQQDGLVQAAVENNSHPPPVPSAPLPSLGEPQEERVHSPVSEPPTARPTEREYFPTSPRFQASTLTNFKTAQTTIRGGFILSQL